MGASGGNKVDLFSAELVDYFLFSATGSNLFAGLLGAFGNLAKVAIGLGLVIFVHELGHFLAAKACGVKVEKFYVGFDVPIRLGPIKIPPRLFRFRRGETEYGIGAIPLGGYVRMLGQDDNPSNAQAEAERIRSGPSGELDPRSYPAKPVWQRMIIISAGVIMNLIFAVIFAALAFTWGVLYTPTMIGEVTPGYPAWNEGITPGGTVIGLGRIENDPSMHFRELRYKVFGHGIKSKTDPLRVVVDYGKEAQEYSVVPTRRHDPKDRESSIGIKAADRAELSLVPGVIPNTASAEVLSDEKFGGAKILTLNGKELPQDDQSDHRLAAPIHFAESNQLDQPMELKLLLKDSKQEETVIVPPQKEKTFGFLWRVGPVSGVMKDSPADKAGLKAGDRIVKVNDQDNLNALSLWHLLFNTRDAMELTVERINEAGKSETVTLKTEAASDNNAVGMSQYFDSFGVAHWGIAFTAADTLADFDGSPVGDATALQSGDKILKVQLQWPDNKPGKTLVSEDLKVKGYSLDRFHTPADLTSEIQYLPLDVVAKVSFEREGRVQETTVKLIESADRYWPERGFAMAALERIHNAHSVGNALSLGLRETGAKLTDVFEFLQLLVTGRISMKMFGGPLGIVYIANSEAAQGIPRLLLFLTLLSANLAVLNFLPIPALDGGHMVFLAAEWIRGKPVDEQLQIRLTVVGVLGLLTMLVIASINDITHLVGG